MNGANLDAYLQLVAHQHRRKLLTQLRREGNGKTSIDDLVERLHEDGSVPAHGPRSDREQLAIQLYHSHLPKLADLGIIEYDLERGTIEYQPDEQIEAVLDSLPHEVSPANP